jgi:hypothetical protein
MRYDSLWSDGGAGQCLSENYRKQRNHVNKVKKKSIQNYFFERYVGGPKSSDYDYYYYCLSLTKMTL